MKIKEHNYLYHKPNEKVYYGSAEKREFWEIIFIIFTFIMAAVLITCGVLMIFVFKLAAFSPAIFILSVPFLFWGIVVSLNRPNRS